MRILIVEDEETLAQGLKFNFEHEGYQAVVATDGHQALELLHDPKAPFDVVILDLMLPGMSGYEICKAIRGFDPALPILVLSSRSLSEDKAHAFDCGSDQYMTKPFVLSELLSRVRNLVNRRANAAAHAAAGTREPEDRHEFGDVVIDFRRFEVTVRGRTHTLTTTESQLLRYFLENEGFVLSRSQILEDVWGQSADITTRTIDNFVLRLRKMLEPNPSQPRYILSVRGTGYRFVRFASDSTNSTT